MLDKVLISVLFSWIGSITLGLIFAWRIFYNEGIKDVEGIMAPGVIQVILIISSIFALLITPLTVWAFKPAKLIYFIMLWFVLALFILFINPKLGTYALYMPFILGLIGVVAIGIIK